MAEHVRLEVGPYTVTGDLHRSPSLPPLNALTRWSRFVPVTGALVEIGADRVPAHHDVVLVNRDRIGAYHELFDAGPAWVPERIIDGAEVPAEVAAEPPPVSPAS